MANVVHTYDEDVGLWPRGTVKLSWAAVFGGVCMALGVTVLLVAVGMAVGLSMIDPSNPATAKPAGIGTGIWAAIVPIIALFLGGVVASRTAGPATRVSGMIHGAVLWGLTTVIGVLSLGWALGGVGTFAARLTSGAAGALGQAGMSVAKQGDQMASAMGMDYDDAIAPVNRRLRSEGKPTVTAEQLKEAAGDMMSTALRDGRLDKETLATSLADNTRLSRADARDVANRLDQGLQERRREMNDQLSKAADDAKHAALTAADKTGKAMGWVSLGLFLGLAASVAGASAGVTRRQQVAAGEKPPLATTREVHP